MTSRRISFNLDPGTPSVCAGIMSIGIPVCADSGIALSPWSKSSGCTTRMALLDRRAREGRWISFDTESCGHRVYWPTNKSVGVERNVYFAAAERLEGENFWRWVHPFSPPRAARPQRNRHCAQHLLTCSSASTHGDRATRCRNRSNGPHWHAPSE